MQKIERQREHDGAVLFGGNLGQRLQITQLQRCRLTADDRGCIRQLLTGDELAFRVNDFRSFLTLGFCLTRHSTLHGLWQLEIAHLDARHLHAPCAGLGVDHLLELGVDLVSLRQQVIQVRLAQDAA